MPALGITDPEADEGERAADPPLSRGTERQGNELLAGVKSARTQLQAIGRAEARCREVEAMEVRPAGPEPFQAQALEPRGDELGGQVVLGRRRQAATEPVARQEEQVGLDVPLAD